MVQPLVTDRGQSPIPAATAVAVPAVAGLEGGSTCIKGSGMGGFGWTYWVVVPTGVNHEGTAVPGKFADEPKTPKVVPVPGVVQSPLVSNGPPRERSTDAVPAMLSALVSEEF